MTNRTAGDTTGPAQYVDKVPAEIIAARKLTNRDMARIAVRNSMHIEGRDLPEGYRPSAGLQRYIDTRIKTPQVSDSSHS